MRSAALLLLTALNFLNYIDRNVLFAVQPLIQKEFHLDDAQDRLSDLGILRLLHGCRSADRAAGRSLFSEMDHGRRRLRLERARPC